MDEILGDPEFRIYGLSIQDILNMSRWLQANNATVKDLDGCSLSWKYWNKQKIFDAVLEK